MKLSVIIPAYNEEKRIGPTLADIYNFLKSKKWDYEIIVVDDGSKDKTTQVAKNNAEEIKVISQTNQGKGAAICNGVSNSTKDWILMTDADNSTRISEIEKFLPFLDSHEVIIGSRAVSGAQLGARQSWFKRELGRAGNFLIKAALGLDLEDTQCGFKLFKKETKYLFKKLRMPRWSFDFEFLFLAKKAGFKIKEVGIHWENDIHSKVKPLDYFKTLFDLVKIKINYLSKKYD